MQRIYALGFDSRSRMSRGTAKTSVRRIGEGGAIRKNGKITAVPLAYKAEKIDFGGGEKMAMTIPWGMFQPLITVLALVMLKSLFQRTQN